MKHTSKSVLRCRKGDLAIVLKGILIGKFITVLSYIGTANRIHPEGHVTMDEDCWLVDSGAQYQPRAYMDCELLPIRPEELDQTETDELSLIKGESA